jgi:hypothetical protein
VRQHAIDQCASVQLNWLNARPEMAFRLGKRTF